MGDGLGKAALSGNTRIAVTDANLVFSPYNWSVQPVQPLQGRSLQGRSVAITNQPGAYFKIGFRSAHISLNVDTEALASLPSSATPVLRWQIDSGALQSYQLAAGDTQIPLNVDALMAGAHLCKVWFVAADYRQDRWTTPAEALRVTGLTLDAGGRTTAPAVSVKRILFFGDSITEGARTESARNIPTIDDDATHAFPYSCAAGLNAEFGVVGVSRQGWTVAGYDGSHVPAFGNAWTLDFAGRPRAFSPIPDYVIVAQGANDTNAGRDPLQVAGAVRNWLGAARVAMPTSRLCLVVPFSGFERDVLTQAVRDYKTEHPEEKNLFLIDLGPDIAGGTSAHPALADLSGAPTPYAYDGFHPNAATSQALGTQIAALIRAAAP